VQQALEQLVGLRLGQPPAPDIDPRAAAEVEPFHPSTLRHVMTAARLAPDFVHYVRAASPWMVWNLLLALVPWALAVVVFDRNARPSPLWWAGAVTCVLLLPNAAYVLTDVIHLPRDIRFAANDAVVFIAVLPAFTALMAIGFLAYVDAVRRLVTWLLAAGWVRRGWPVVLAMNAACALGIYAGRVHRFNSWDAILRPHAVAEAVAGGFTRPTAKVGMLGTFAVLTVGYLVTTATFRAVAHRRAA